jgi:thymidylate synthase (FAD)
MKVELIDNMGSDLTVVNAARVSFNKQHMKVEEGDYSLIKYLAKHHHWSPFAHCFVQFRIKAPIFVARQLGKHQVGLCWNEISRRYVNYDPEFWTAQEGFRAVTADKKQGSGGLSPFNQEAKDIQNRIHRSCLAAYQDMLKIGICEEQARTVLPQSMMTEWFWSGSLFSFSRVCNLRMSEDSQKETKEIAVQIDKECAKLYPHSWKALTFNYEIGEG